MSMSEIVAGGVAQAAPPAAEVALLREQLRQMEGHQERRARHAALGGDVARALSRASNMRAVLQATTEALVARLDAAFARIWTLNAGENVLELNASAGLYTHLNGPHARVPVGAFKIGLIAAERLPHLTNDVLHDPRVGNPEWARREGMVSFAGYPLLLDGRLLGVMALFARAPLPDDTLQALASIADIVALGIDRKRADEALRVSEARHRLFAEASRDGILFWEAGSDTLTANTALLATLGLTAADWVGTRDDMLQRVHPDDRARVTSALADHLQRGALFEQEDVRLRHSGGHYLICRTRGKCERDATGTPVRMAAGIADVTERRGAEERRRFIADASALLASSLQYERTVATAAALAVPAIADWCAIDVVQGDGKLQRVAVAHVDPSKVALAQELQRRYPMHAGDPHGPPAVIRSGEAEILADISDDLLAATAPDPEYLALVRQLGVRASVCVPLIAHGKTLGALSLVIAESQRPLTPADVEFAEELARRVAVAVENARLYAELGQLNTSLERRVEQRTRELVEANRELEAFSYTISHDLRAPVRHISGFADLLQRSAGAVLDGKSQRYLTTIDGAAKQMGSLIDALLAFSRIGRADLTCTRVSLDALVKAVVQELEPEIQGRDISWSIAPLPEVDGDPVMLRAVVGNLIANAVKYTRKRDRAHIGIGPMDGGALQPGEVGMFVRDDGVGFNMQYAGKLFGVFQRLNVEFEGTGIGLATVRRVIQRHKGRVWGEGREGEGATFFVAFPARAT